VSAVTTAKFDLTATPGVKNLFSKSLPAASRIAFADIASDDCNTNKQIQNILGTSVAPQEIYFSCLLISSHLMTVTTVTSSNTEAGFGTVDSSQSMLMTLICQ